LAAFEVAALAPQSLVEAPFAWAAVVAEATVAAAAVVAVVAAVAVLPQALGNY
jgi:hypothetical protein